MVKIEIGKDCGSVEVEGKGDTLIIETGLALYDCIRILKECGKSDAFIEAMFKIALSHKGEDDD
jgi:hypothetical protein